MRPSQPRVSQQQLANGKVLSAVKQCPCHIGISFACPHRYATFRDLVCETVKSVNGFIGCPSRVIDSISIAVAVGESTREEIIREEDEDAFPSLQPNGAQLLHNESRNVGSGTPARSSLGNYDSLRRFRQSRRYSEQSIINSVKQVIHNLPGLFVLFFLHFLCLEAVLI